MKVLEAKGNGWEERLRRDCWQQEASAESVCGVNILGFEGVRRRKGWWRKEVYSWLLTIRGYSESVQYVEWVDKVLKMLEKERNDGEEWLRSDYWKHKAIPVVARTRPGSTKLPGPGPSPGSQISEHGVRGRGRVPIFLRCWGRCRVGVLITQNTGPESGWVRTNLYRPGAWGGIKPGLIKNLKIRFAKIKLRNCVIISYLL